MVAQVRFLTTIARIFYVILINQYSSRLSRALGTLWSISYHQRSWGTRHSGCSTSLLSFVVDAAPLSFWVKCCHWPLLLWVFVILIEIREHISVAVSSMITPCPQSWTTIEFSRMQVLLFLIYFSMAQSRDVGILLLSRIARFGKNRTNKRCPVKFGFQVNKNKIISINLAYACSCSGPAFSPGQR